MMFLGFLPLPLFQFEPFGPCHLLTDADAKRASIAVHYPSTSHLVPTLIYPLYFHFSSILYAHLHLPLPFGRDPSQGLYVVIILICLFQRDTCCRMLPLCRIAEFSCLLNLLTTFNYLVLTLFFTPSLNPHLNSHPFSSFTFVSFSSGLSFFPHPTRACTHAVSKNDRSH